MQTEDVSKSGPDFQQYNLKDKRERKFGAVDIEKDIWTKIANKAIASLLGDIYRPVPDLEQRWRAKDRPAAEGHGAKLLASMVATTVPLNIGIHVEVGAKNEMVAWQAFGSYGRAVDHPASLPVALDLRNCAANRVRFPPRNGPVLAFPRFWTANPPIKGVPRGIHSHGQIETLK